MSHATRLLAGTGLAFALLASMPAARAVEPINILFTGHGDFAGPGSWIGKADDWAGDLFPIAGDWDVYRTEFYDQAARSMTGTFEFIDTVGDNDLWGRFVGGWEGVGDMNHIRVFNNFVIEGGTGIFKGATSMFGEDRVYTDYLTGHYVESGLFKVIPVPEPSKMLMLAAGVLAIAALRRRRS